MKTFALLIPTVVSLTACQSAHDVTVAHAWVRRAAVPANPSAAYFTLDGGSKNETLTGVSAPAAQRAEMHESMSSGGMMTMAPVKAVQVSSGATVTFAPGGKHVMLFGLKPEAKPGTTTLLTFTFASGRTLTVPARVVGAGDPAPAQ